MVMVRTTPRAREIDKFLLRNEKCVVLARRHWAMVAPQGTAIVVTWTAWALVLAAAPPSAIDTVAAFFYVLSAAWFGWLLTEWHREQLAVTDKRVLLITGLITKKLAVMPLTKVTDMTYERSPWGRLLGYGTFVMESAGQHQALSRIDFVAHPDRLYRRLSEQLFGDGARSSAGRNHGEPPANPLSRAGTVRLPRVP
jgi:membrane protein YdbS with pleckstrin-like domain